jgi:hypothetical protein
VVTERLEHRAQAAREIGRDGDGVAEVGSVRRADAAVVVAQDRGVQLHHEAVVARHRWTADIDGPPIRFRHQRCHHFVPTVTCSVCGEPIRHEDVDARPGPGGDTGPGTQLIGTLLATRATD